MVSCMRIMRGHLDKAAAVPDTGRGRGHEAVSARSKTKRLERDWMDSGQPQGSNPSEWDGE